MTRRRRVLQLLLALAFAAAAAVLPMAPAAANSVVTVDSSGDVGKFSSMALDPSGNPVVAYLDYDNSALKVLHCYDPNCANTGTNRINVADTEVRGGISLALDPAGNPVVSYIGSDSLLHVLHCYDPDCANAGSRSVTTHSEIGPSLFTALRMDGANPVVAHSRVSETTPRLSFIRCDDPNCAGEETVVDVGEGLFGAFGLGMALDSARRPVIVTTPAIPVALVVVRCNDLQCTAPTVALPDAGSIVGSFASVTLDAQQNPVVGYHGAGNRLSVLHCYDPACANFGTNVISQPDPATGGGYVSIALAPNGDPVIAHSFGDAQTGLRVVRCNDANCAGGDDSVVVVDPDPFVGYFASLRLDGRGFPVVAYHDTGGADLRVAHCTSAACSDTTPPGTTINLDPPDPTGNAGWYTSPVGLDIVSTDDDSGVAETRCVVDPQTPPVTFGDLPAGPCATTSVGSDGEHQVFAAAIDRDGNTGAVVSRTFRIDRTPPITALSRFPANPTGLNGWYWEPVTILLGADDIPPGSGPAETRCVLDPAVTPGDYHDLPGPCTTVPVTAEGSHILYAASADVAGNFDALTVNSFGIDMTPPSAAVTLAPPAPDGENGWYVSPVQVGVTGTDNASGIGQVRCALDPSFTPGSVQDLPPPPCFMGAVGADGEHRYFGGTMDVAGHFSVLASAEFKVDRTFPQSFASLLPFEPDGDNGWYRSPVVINMFLDDGTAELRCALDPPSRPGGFGDLPGPPCSVRMVLDDGDHALYWAAKDPAGNTEALRETAFRIDTTAPTTGITLDPPEPDGANNWYVSPVTVSVGGISDDIVETRCVLNPPTQPLGFADLPDAPCDSAVVEAEGSHVVYAASRDEAGNTEAPVARTFQIQRTTPMTTVSFDPPEPDGDNGWYSSDVSVVVAGPDGAEVRCAVNPDPAPRTFDDLPDEACFLLDPEDPAAIARAGWLTIGRVGPLSLEDGVNVLYVASRHPSGISEDPISVTVRIDRQAPTLEVTVEPDEIVVGGSAEVIIDASDASSGIAESGCDPLDTTEVGEKTITCSATDYAGHVVTVTVTYIVVAESDDPPDGSTTTTTTNDPGGTSTTTTSTTVAGGDDGGGGGDDDLPHSGIEASRLVVLALTWLMVGTALVHMARTRRLRWPAGRW